MSWRVLAIGLAVIFATACTSNEPRLTSHQLMVREAAPKSDEAPMLVIGIEKMKVPAGAPRLNYEPPGQRVAPCNGTAERCVDLTKLTIPTKARELWVSRLDDGTQMLITQLCRA